MTLNIPANDHGHLYIFTLRDALPAVTREAGAEALAPLLGVADLAPEYVEVLDPAQLGDISLPTYLRDGYAYTPEPEEANALEQVQGPIAIVMSRAFKGDPHTVNPANGVTHLMTLKDNTQPVMPINMQSTSAEGVVPGHSGPANPIAPAAAPTSWMWIGGIVLAALIAVIYLYR